MTAIIEAQGLAKSYRIRHQSPGLSQAVKSLFRPRYELRHVLKEISFRIEEGSITGLMGPNGAGKSTLVKLLVGIILQDDGTLTVSRLDPFHQRLSLASRIGVVFGQRSNLLWDLPVAESFELHRAVFQIPRREFASRLEELTALFDLETLLHQPARTLSLGQTMRCAVAQVLLQQPDILFLDEPTIGLDLVSIERLSGILTRLNQTLGTTIVMTSHDLSIVESTCSQVILLDEGRILFDGTSRAALEKYGNYRKLRFVFSPGTDLTGAMGLLEDRGINISRQAFELVGVVHAAPGSINGYTALANELTHSHGLLEFFLEKPSMKEVILHAFD
jgi:ABC-2 type transport system ATP-binding protein